jgi:hypothetical protein
LVILSLSKYFVFSVQVSLALSPRHLSNITILFGFVKRFGKKIFGFV